MLHGTHPPAAAPPRQPVLLWRGGPKSEPWVDAVVVSGVAEARRERVAALAKPLGRGTCRVAAKWGKNSVPGVPRRGPPHMLQRPVLHEAVTRWNSAAAAAAAAAAVASCPITESEPRKREERPHVYRGMGEDGGEDRVCRAPLSPVQAVSPGLGVESCSARRARARACTVRSNLLWTTWYVGSASREMSIGWLWMKGELCSLIGPLTCCALLRPISHESVVRSPPLTSCIWSSNRADGRASYDSGAITDKNAEFSDAKYDFALAYTRNRKECVERNRANPGHYVLHIHARTRRESFLIRLFPKKI